MRRPSLLARALLLWLIALACVLLTGGLSQVYAQEPSLDYQVKAAMVYKFLSYGTWPANRFADAKAPYRIWVIGSDDIKNELQEMVVQRSVDGRAIEIYSAKTVDQVGDAHLVFVSRSMEPVLPKLCPLARKNSFLIVTENEKGLAHGSTINLRLVDKRVGFDISVIDAQAYGITLSSRLLAIAITVKEQPN